MNHFLDDFHDDFIVYRAFCPLGLHTVIIFTQLEHIFPMNQEMKFEVKFSCHAVNVD